jgi:Xaa-Pro dipeptidase
MNPPANIASSMSPDVSLARGLGNAAYTEQSYLNLDRSYVLAPRWIAIALVEDAPIPGTVFPTQAAGQPLLVSKDEQGDLRVFHNICRHRGTCLVTKTGARAAIVCPYHGWTYALNGALTRTPDFSPQHVEDTPSVPAESNGLLPVRFSVWNHIIFVNLDGRAPPLADRMSGLDRRWQHLDFTRIQHGVSAHFEVRANWKLVTENFLESYHLPFVHRTLNAYSALADHSVIVEGDSHFGQSSTRYVPNDKGVKQLPHFPGLDDSQTETAEYLCVFPSTWVSFAAEHFRVTLIEPIAPNITRLRWEFFFVNEQAVQPELQDSRDHWPIGFSPSLKRMRTSLNGYRWVGNPTLLMADVSRHITSVACTSSSNSSPRPTQPVNKRENSAWVPPRLDGRPDVDIQQLVKYRRGRLRAELERNDIALAILTNPVTLRYVADFRDYALFQAHIPIYYAFLGVSGPLVMHGAGAQSTGMDIERQPARSISAFNAGPNLSTEAKQLAEDVRKTLTANGATNSRVAVEAANPSLIRALIETGIEVVDATFLVDHVRAIKSAAEIQCMRWSIQVAEFAMRQLRDAMHPGVSENQLWSVLNAVNIANDGDWSDGRMLCSGPRTNPWLQHATDRIIEAGDLVAFDTDLVGPFGYCADISRTWICGDAPPTGEALDLYQRAAQEIHENMARVKAGVTFNELSQGGFRQPDRFIGNRYVCLAHGVGMCDEWPKIPYRQDWANRGYDGELVANMVLCVESYVGAQKGAGGVKLEQQILVTKYGYELLSTYPLETDWL